MKRFYAIEGEMYVNYISLFTEKPVKLDDVPFNYDVRRKLSVKKARQLVYTEKEAKRLQQLYKEIILVEIKEII
jgi:hypothetical protein